MTARTLKLIIAGILFLGFAYFSNYFTRIGVEKWAAVASIAAILAILYIAIDIIVATETSFLYRINRWWIEPNSYRVSAIILAIGCVVLVVFLIGKLVSP
jgi:hypothetical protein